MGFYDFDGFTSLLSRSDLSGEDRLMVCKTMADLCAMGDNAIKMSVCPGLPEALADILSSTPGGRTDERHQAFAALCVTRCVSKCSSETCTKWALTPGLVDGLSTLRKSEDKFLQCSALVALRMFVRCDDAVGSSRKLLRLKWRGALVEGSSSSRSRSESGSIGGFAKPPHSAVDEAAMSAQRQHHNGSHIERVPDNAIQHHYHSHGGRAHMMPAGPQAPGMNSQGMGEADMMMQQHRMPASQGTSSSTPFSSSRLGSVQQRAQPQSVPASPLSLPQSVPQSPHSLQPMPMPSHQNRWMGEASSASSRPPPLAYSDFSSSKAQDDFHSQGQHHDAMSWASARETKQHDFHSQGQHYSDNTSRSPYSSANSAYSAGPNPHNPHNLALGSMQNFALRTGGYSGD